MIHDKAWDEQARQEWKAARREAWEFSDSQSERTDRYLAILRDAVQAHRRWAIEALAECERVGAAAQLKSWNKAQSTVAVSYKGEVITKSRTAGIQRAKDDGTMYPTQTLFDFFTWKELRDKRSAYLKQVKTYTANVGLIDRLLALQDLVPEALTPSEAVAQLGTSLDEWLGTEAA